MKKSIAGRFAKSRKTRADERTAPESAVRLAFRLDADEWQGVRRVRFLVEGAEI